MVEDEIIFQTDIIIAETTERVTKELSEKIFSGIERDDCYEFVHSLQFIEIWESFALYNSGCRLKKSFVSFLTTPFNASSAIKFGNAISALKISAMFHTAATVI